LNARAHREANRPEVSKFYEGQFSRGHYAAGLDRAAASIVREVVDERRLRDVRALEVGCGRGTLSDLTRWVGIDLALTAGTGIGRPFVCGSAGKLPFRSGQFDFVFSINVLEHVGELDSALEEIGRVTRPGGFVLLRPAWFCRPWAAQGYEVRSYSDLELSRRLVKATIPIRNSILYRLPGVLVRRMWRELGNAASGRARPLRYRRLQPNYEIFWQSDSDACNSIDPHAVVLWFRQRGWEAIGRMRFLERISIRSGPVLLRKPGACLPATSC